MSESLLADLWCADFDAAIEKVVPGALETLGDAGRVELRTYSNLTNGRINCPAAWHTDMGLTAFFATRQYGNPTPPGYVPGSKQCVTCTFEEVVRDEWIHGQVVVVDGRFVWKPPENLMMQLMYDLRGWTVLDDLQRARIQANVTASLAKARGRLEAVAA